MRKLLLATAAAAAVAATPAAARDGSGYIGVEGGVLFPKDNDADLIVDFDTTNATVPPGGVVPGATPAGPSDTVFENAFGTDYKTGFDIDLIAGYDFGMFRVEGELGYKRAKADELEIDSGDITALNAALNRPAGVGDPGTPGFPAIVDTDFDLDGDVKVWSGMLNGLLDFGGDSGIGAYVGGGIGYANVKAFDESDSAIAYQLIAGLYFGISPNIDLGLKYRYFRTGKLDFSDDTAFAVDGNPNLLDVGGVPVVQTTDAFVTTDVEQKFRSHSLLASLVFNFGSAAEPLAPLPPPPPPPPVAEAPATQTCPDGSVILATSSCPLPPPPPPPPPSAGERGR